MELEKLEIIIDANAEMIEKNLQKVMPTIEKITKSMGMKFEGMTDKVDKSMDVSDGTSRMEKQMEQMTKFFQKQTEMMEKQSQSMGQNVSKNMSSGITKARKSVGKDVDAMVNEINAKIEQAGAKERQLALLKAQRQGSLKKGDTKGVIKYDNQIATAQAQMVKYQDTAKNTARQMKQEFDSIPKTLDELARKMEVNQKKMSAMKSNLAEMQSRRETATDGGQASFRRSRSKVSLPKLDESIANQSAKIQKLRQENHALGQAYEMTEQRMTQFSSAIPRVNKLLNQQSRETETAGSGMRKFGRITEGTRGLMSRLSGLPSKFGNVAVKGFGVASSAVRKFGNAFTIHSKNTDKGLARNSRGMFTLGTQIKMMFRTFVFYGLLYKGLMELSKGLWSALKANDEFNTSLNQVQVNLLTAFYPIYETVLPLINMLMRALSQATAIFAGFIATLFGTTYSAAKQGAKGLYESIQAMNESGTAADKNKEKIKQMQRSLMGFDEINNLSTQNADLDTADTGSANKGVDFSIPDQKIPDWVVGWANQAKKIWKDFFKPIQDAWDNQGQRVMDAFKYALNEIWGVVKSIGNSFMDVWTNGTGQRFVENLLILLGDVLYIIGDIAQAFKNAWNDGGRGTNLIQSYFDKWNAILELLHEIADAFRNAWNDGRGERIAGYLLEIYTNLNIVIANLANGFKDAWKNASTGESIIGTILDFVGDLLEGINKITESTANWAKKLDFTPLLESIDKLLKSIQPITKAVFDGIAWAWENILLPLASYVIEDAIPHFFNLFADALEIIGIVIEKLKPFIKWLFDKLINPIVNFTLASSASWLEFLGKFADALVKLIDTDIYSFQDVVDAFTQFGKDIWDGLKEGIASMKDNIGTFVKESMFDPIVNWFKKLFGIHSPSTLFAKYGVNIVEGLFNGIKSIMSKPKELITGIWEGMKKTVSEKTSQVWTKSKELWGKTGTTIKDSASNAGKWVSDKWGNISKSTSGTWDNVKKWTSDKWGSAKKSVTDNAKGIWDNTKSKWSDVTKNTKTTWDNFQSKITDTTKKAKENASSKMSDMKTNLKNRFSETWTSAKSNFDNILSKISGQSSNASSRGSSAFRTMKNNMSGSLDSLKNTTKSAFDKIASWATNLPNRIATGLKNGVKAIKNAASSIANGIVGIVGKAMNGVISGINWVLGKVGAGKSKLTKWTIPKYATGTGYHKGGLALVNDGLGSNYQEAFRTPDGQTGLFPKQRNMIVNLPKGSSVLSGQRTANMMKGLPAYANGVGDWFKEKWNGAKQIASDVWSYASNPSKLLNVAISKYVDLSNAVQPALNMAKGTVATVASGATKWVTDKFNVGYKKHQEEVAASQSFGSGAFAPHFKNPPFVQTSDFGPRAALFGRTYHNGMDYGAPTGTSLPAQHPGSVSYAGWASGYGNLVAIKVADNLHTLYGHMNSISVRLGQSIKRNQRIGAVGSTGDSTGPHVHYGLSKGGVFGTALDPKTYGQVSSGAIVGSLSGVKKFAPSVARWQGTVEKALSMLGLLNVSNVNATLNQIRTESNGNPNAINLWDINARNGIPSKGLLQVIDPTFRAYARSPYNKNIWDPLSNILASMRYATSRYGSLTRAYRGVGYENGGLVTQDGLYRMGEGNKKEMVLPLEKPNLAMELIEKALNYMGIDWSNAQISMPDIFQPTAFTQPNRNFANDSSTRYEGSGMQQGLEAMMNGLLMAVQAIGGQTQQAPNGDIIINIGGKEFGRIAVKEINNYHKQLGYTELNL